MKTTRKSFYLTLKHDKNFGIIKNIFDIFVSGSLKELLKPWCFLSDSGYVRVGLFQLTRFIRYFFPNP